MEEPQYNTETIREYLRHQDSTWSQRIMQWYRDGFQANPTCRSEAETAICLLYERAGYPPPSRFVWFLSPFDLVSSLHFEIETEHIPRSENLNSFKVAMIARIAEAENASVFYTPLSLHPKTPRWYEQFKSEVVKAWMKSPYIDSFQELYGFEYHWGSTILMAL